MPPEIHRASPGVGPSSMVDKIAEKSFSGMQGLMVAEDRKLKEKDVNSLPSVSNKMLCFFGLSSQEKKTPIQVTYPMNILNNVEELNIFVYIAPCLTPN